MLQRQQASAIVAARQKIVEGAVGMVDLALNKLADQNVVDLNEERKAPWSATCWSFCVESTQLLR